MRFVSVHQSLFDSNHKKRRVFFVVQSTKETINAARPAARWGFHQYIMLWLNITTEISWEYFCLKVKKEEVELMEN